MRGIVISTPTFVTEEGAFGTGSELDDQLLRCWLLYWDKLDLPRLREGLLVETALDEFLGRMGVLERSMLSPDSNLKDGEVLTWPLLKAHEMRNRKQPGLWSLAMGTGALVLPERLYVTRPGLEVSLLRSIPIPDRVVPLEDILTFKARRNEELAQLWEAVDEISEQYQDDPSRPLAEQAAVRRFARSATDAIRLTQEAGFPFRLANVSARYAAAALLGSSLPVAFGGGLADIVGNGLLAAGSMLIGEVGGMGTVPGRTPFAYLIRYDAEVLGSEK